MRADVVICGAGAVGCAIAREVAGEGASVLVLERGTPGGEASGAAAGLLTPQSHASAPSPFVNLARSSLLLYPALADELARETSIDVELNLCGSVRLAAGEAGETGDESDETEMSKLLSWQEAAGWRAQRIGADRLARLSRGRLSRNFRSAIEFPDEGTVDVRRLNLALWKSAEARGAEFRLGESVESFVLAGNRCTGVATRGGRIDAGIVVNAAGAWAGGFSLSLPVRPVRGQIVELRDAGPALFCPILRKDFYIVPLSGNRILLGSTQEDAGFEKTVTADGMRILLERAVELVPSLAAAEVSGAWAGLRPGTPDSLPLLGETSVEGLFVATGHFRNGILLAPLTAKILAALVFRRETPVALEAFRAERFVFTPPNESW